MPAPIVVTSQRASRGFLVTLAAAALLAVNGPAAAAELLVGGATVSITPDRPVALSGQMHTRIARHVESPCTATALALETRDGESTVGQAVLVSCDLVAIREGILEQVRERVKPRLDGFDPQKLVLSATHTHTAPVMAEGRYEIPKEGVMQPAEYQEFLVDRLAEVVEKAWTGRVPGQAGWGMGHAVVAQNRRAVYRDGTAQMYGKTNRDEFLRIEGYEDHSVDVLFFWDRDKKLIATAVNVPCPAQEVEGRSAVNADFWHEVREELRRRHGEDLLVLGWTGAAGDQSPHLMFRQAAEERMRRLRGVSRLQELARRIVAAWEEAYEGARQEMHADLPLVHTVQTIALPQRMVTDEEYAEAKAQVRALSEDPKNRRRMLWQQAVVERYEQQTPESTYEMELHVIRLGDVAIATNGFELFTDYGIQMKARSPALQTFVVQLSGPGTYLPSDRAVPGGGYSAIVQSSVVGPEGGQVLVDRTVEAIKSLWASESKE